MRAHLALVLAAGLVGCGSSGSGGGGDKTAPFVGTWTVVSGTQTTSCPPPVPTIPPAKLDGDHQTIAKATAPGADLSIAIVAGCNLDMTVDGKVATLKPDQTCTIMTMGLQVTGKIAAGTFTVDGSTAMFNYNGSALIGALTCTFSASGTSMKGAGPDGGANADGGGTVDGGAPDGP